MSPTIGAIPQNQIDAIPLNTLEEAADAGEFFILGNGAISRRWSGTANGINNSQRVGGLDGGDYIDGGRYLDLRGISALVFILKRVTNTALADADTGVPDLLLVPRMGIISPQITDSTAPGWMLNSSRVAARFQAFIATGAASTQLRSEGFSNGGGVSGGSVAGQGVVGIGSADFRIVLRWTIASGAPRADSLYTMVIWGQS